MSGRRNAQINPYKILIVKPEENIELRVHRRTSGIILRWSLERQGTKGFCWMKIWTIGGYF